MGCMLENTNEKNLDINLDNELNNSHLIIQNQQIDFNNFLLNEISSNHNTVQTFKYSS